MDKKQKNSKLANKTVIEKAGFANVNWEKKCRMLKTLPKDMKATKISALIKHHKEKRWKLVKKYMKNNSSAIFLMINLELHWCVSWWWSQMLHGNIRLLELRKQQDGVEHLNFVLKTIKL